MTQKLIALIVLVVVASLSIAGCTTTNNTNQTPSATTTSAATQHDAFLEKYLTVYKAAQYSDPGQHVQAWQLDWINSSSARIQFTVLNKSENMTVNSDGIR